MAAAAKGKKIVGKAVNVGPARGDNRFPPSNKARANTSSRGGGGAAGDGSAVKAVKTAKTGKGGKS
jgi:hypothetical protein